MNSGSSQPEFFLSWTALTTGSSAGVDIEILGSSAELSEANVGEAALVNLSLSFIEQSFSLNTLPLQGWFPLTFPPQHMTFDSCQESVMAFSNPLKASTVFCYFQ